MPRTGRRYPITSSEDRAGPGTEELKSWFTETTGHAVTSVLRLGGGRNSRVYRVTCDNTARYAVKVYFPRHGSHRESIVREFASLRFMWEAGMREIPQPIAMDGDLGYAVYEYIEGYGVSSAEVTTSDIDGCVEFLRKLRQLSDSPGSENLPAASEACFSLRDLLANIDMRLSRLISVAPLHSALAGYLSRDFVPTLTNVTGCCWSRQDGSSEFFESDLSRGERTFSPSDFGFHNAIRRRNGQLVFLDFEHCGWDDPAKMVSDFLLHPAMDLTDSLKRHFVGTTLASFDACGGLARRLETVYPLFGLKWCLIMLNEFLPDHLMRRGFASADTIGIAELQNEQLAKAGRMLQRVRREYEHFPYHGKSLERAAPVLDARSLDLRNRIVRVITAGRRGHIGSAFSLVEILRVLYDDVLRYDPKNPKWPGRDRCLLSKGHGCLALYVILAEKGFFPAEELAKFCKSDGILGGHPEHKVAGIEASTGSLGHGLSIGIGFALNARYEKADHRTFVIVGDGESNEGSVWEAAMCAGKHGLSNLTVLVDYNKHQSYGSTYEVQNLEPFADKWRSFGFAATEVDGHSVEELRSVLTNLPLDASKPSAVICHTIKGKGVDFVENDMEWHHKSRVTDDEIEALHLALEVD